MADDGSTNGHATGSMVLKNELYRAVDGLGDAYRAYADELLAGLEGPLFSEAAGQLREFQSYIHELFAGVSVETIRAHPELVEDSAFMKPRHAAVVLARAGITTAADLQLLLETAADLQLVLAHNALEQNKGIGAATAREIRKNVDWVRDQGLVA